MTENTKQYWKESIKGGIDSYLNHMIDVAEEGDMVSKVPCLCVEEWPKVFQIILKFQYTIDDDIPLVYNQKILDYEIPKNFTHGYTIGEMEKNIKVLDEIIKEINDEF